MADHQPKGDLDISTPATVELTTKEIRAVQLRIAGLTYQDIATQLGVTKGTAWKTVQRALDRWGWNTVDEYRKLELQTLAAMQQRLWPQALGHPGRPAGVDEGGNPTEEIPPRPPDKDAVTLILRISERRARLLGMDAPERVELEGTVVHDVTRLRDLDDYVALVHELGGDPGIVDADIEELDDDAGD